ncbi:hypothetical protein AHiyo1_28370 [Arthrobacter sp. Hiyo1]|nr:hypothetical protein AHiyo1_28370 [Arthrobacter sp. Hiyo1]
MCGAEVFQELLVSSCFFQGVQLAPVEVLQQSITEEIVIVGIADNRRDSFEPGSLYSPPSTLTHHQLIRFSTLFG